MSVESIFRHFPKLKFRAGDYFVWSPQQKTIYYDAQRVESQAGKAALLHEIGHAKLKHRDFEYDMELVNMEVAAWEKARELAADLDVSMDEEHINSCLETYRIWLFKRSRCPECSATGVQKNSRLYRCFMCAKQWRVALTRTTQPRRMKCLSD
jgi:hypothetical protein